jgi:hypothetical protein
MQVKPGLHRVPNNIKILAVPFNALHTKLDTLRQVLTGQMPALIVVNIPEHTIPIYSI